MSAAAPENYANLDGARIIAGLCTIPYFGLWHADVVLAEPMPLDTSSMVLTIGNLKLTGTEVRAASFSGSRSVRLVGGFGGWRKKATAKFYQSEAGVMASTVLGDVANEVGEKVKLQADRTIGNAYTREADLAALVLDVIGLPLWYVLPDGTTYIGDRTTKVIASQLMVTAYVGDAGKLSIGTEDIASFMPANTFQSPTVTKPRTISSVMHTIDNGKVRTEVLSVS